MNTVMLRPFYLVSAIAGFLAGCANSPLMIAHMDAQEIRTVSNEDLCRTYTTHHGTFAGDSYTVRQEVKRRGIDCGIPGSLRLLSVPASTYGGVPAGGGTGFLKHDYVSGLNRICVYDQVGSEVAVTVGAADVCPLTLP